MRSSAQGVYGMSASVPGFARVLLHDDFPPPSHTPEMSGCRGAAGAAGRSEQPDTNVTAASNPANAIKNGYRTCKISLLRKLPQYSRLELSAVGEHYLSVQSSASSCAAYRLIQSNLSLVELPPVRRMSSDARFAVKCPTKCPGAQDGFGSNSPNVLVVLFIITVTYR